MRPFAAALFVILASIAVWTPLPYADGSENTLRCGSRIIKLGDTRFEVRSKCGEPASRDTRFEKRFHRSCPRDPFDPTKERRRCNDPIVTEELVEVDEWIYNPGPTGFIRFLTFENGRLIRIELGDYGF